MGARRSTPSSGTSHHGLVGPPGIARAVSVRVAKRFDEDFDLRRKKAPVGVDGVEAGVDCELPIGKDGLESARGHGIADLKARERGDADAGDQRVTQRFSAVAGHHAVEVDGDTASLALEYG